MNDTFSGVWKSSHKYYDKARGSYYWNEYYVQAYHRGDTLIFESIPEVNEAYIFVRLHVDEDLATGSWHEETSKKGFFGGQLYVGALQLVIDDNRKRLAGKWVAYDKDKTIDDGVWELAYIGQDLPDGTEIIQAERAVVCL